MKIVQELASKQIKFGNKNILIKKDSSKAV